MKDVIIPLIKAKSGTGHKISSSAIRAKLNEAQGNCCEEAYSLFRECVERSLTHPENYDFEWTSIFWDECLHS
jgi:hypothetical protein